MVPGRRWRRHMAVPRSTSRWASPAAPRTDHGTRIDTREGVPAWSTEGDLRFVFSEEQHALRDAVRRFLRQHSSEQDVRRLMETANGYDSAVWKQMAGQLGLQSLTIPEKFGGARFTFTGLIIVFEEMGAALVSAPFFSTLALAAKPLRYSEDTAAPRELL